MDLSNLFPTHNNIIDPLAVRKRFNSEFEFYVWVEGGSVKALQKCLKVFENWEMYEDCCVIRDVITAKTEAEKNG
jgi:hypothetical protein